MQNPRVVLLKIRRLTEKQFWEKLVAFGKFQKKFFCFLHMNFELKAENNLSGALYISVFRKL
jgi:hypothetical protein